MALWIVAFLAISASRIFLLVLAALAAIIILAKLVRRWRRVVAVRRFRAAFGSKDLLLVYTDSPHWKDYSETNWVGRWSDRVVILNRSRPWSRIEPQAALWLRLKGFVEHTPLAIIVPQQGPVRIVRFFKAFRDFKHGDAAPLHAAESELVEALEGSDRSS